MRIKEILIAESDPNLGELMKIIFEKGGYSVTGMVSTLEDFRVMVDNPKVAFDTAFINKYLPDRGQGEEAAKYLYGHRPEVSVTELSSDEQPTFSDSFVVTDGTLSVHKLLQAVSSCFQYSTNT